MEITIIGKGGFAREVESYFLTLTDYSMIDTCLPEDYKGGAKVIAIADPNIRQKVAKELGGMFASFNFSKSFVVHGDIEFSEGTIICPDVILTTNIKIGYHGQFNIQTSIGHDCNIGDFVTTAPKVSISGNVTIGNRVYIGTGAIIKEKTYICDDVIIGAGAVVLNDIIEPGTYVGIPAKKIK